MVEIAGVYRGREPWSRSASRIGTKFGRHGLAIKRRPKAASRLDRTHAGATTDSQESLRVGEAAECPAHGGPDTEVEVLDLYRRGPRLGVSVLHGSGKLLTVSSPALP